MLIEECDGDQPPQRRVDAAEVPEVGLAPARIDEFRDLAIGGLVPGERMKPVTAARSSFAIAGHGHADGADRRIPPENRGVAALPGALAGRGGENPGRRKVALEQRDGFRVAGREKLRMGIEAGHAEPLNS